MEELPGPARDRVQAGGASPKLRRRSGGAAMRMDPLASGRH
jgi:hypothetical protein